MMAKLLSWWKGKIKPLETIGLIILLVGFFALIVIIIIGYIFNWDWTGLGPYKPPHPYESNFQRGKTLWDWLQLLIIPVVLAVAGYLFNLTVSRNEQKSTKLRDQTEREISTNKQREAALQQYIDKMSELLSDKKLRESQSEDEVRKIARVRTLTVLPRLDADRKKNVLLFLYESTLIEKSKPIIDLKDADLSHANPSEANLSLANLSKADFRLAKFNRTKFSNANLSGASFSRTKFRYRGVVDLRRNTLSDANLTQEQIDTIKSLTNTIMPDEPLAP